MGLVLFIQCYVSETMRERERGREREREKEREMDIIYLIHEDKL